MLQALEVSEERKEYSSARHILCLSEEADFSQSERQHHYQEEEQR
jgi:hypothetical protein